MGADLEPEEASKTAPNCELLCGESGIDYTLAPITRHLLHLKDPEQWFASFDGFLVGNGIAASRRHRICD